MAEDEKKVKIAEFFNNLESIVRGRVKHKPIHQNPSIAMINSSRAIRRKRKRNRKKEKKKELRKIAEEMDQNFNKCGFKSDIEVVNNIQSLQGLREEWPSNHPLYNITNTEASVAALIEEIRTMNVGENLVPVDKWQSFYLLRDILRKLVKRHQKAPYKYMAWHYASRLSYGIKDQMDDFKKTLPCKRHYPSSADERQSAGLSPNSDLAFLKFANSTAKENTQEIHKGNNLDKAVHPQEVLQFLNSCVQHSIPHDFFGCAHNRRIFLTRWLNVLIGVPGRKSIGLGSLMKGVRIAQVPWTTDASPIGGRGQRACVLAKAWLWLLLKYLSVILSCYYVLIVTSGENVGGGPIAFFAKRTWQSMKYSTLRYHTESHHTGSSLKHTNRHDNKGWTITQISSEEIEKVARPKGYPLTCHLQLKPKKNSMRPFLQVRVSKEDYTKFKACVALIQYLTCKNRKRCPTRNTTNDLYQAWEDMYKLKESTLQMNDGNEKIVFYAVNVDIEDAFGCVLQDKLCGIIKEKLEMAELKPETVLVLKTAKYCKKDRRGKKYFSLRDILLGFPKVQNQERNTSGTKSSQQYTINLEVGDLYEFIERCIKFQTIKIGKTNYRLSRGLAQGSPLSPCLWNLYCDAMEDQHLFPHLSIRDDASKFSYLIRGVDDYLFLTEVREEAEWFLRRMMHGFPDYNASINLSKTCTTLSSAEAKTAIKEKHGVHSCIGVKFWGLVLNPSKLSVMVDYDGPPGRDLTHVMNHYRHKNPKSTIEAQSKVRRLKLSPFLLNAEYNGYEGVLCNIFRAALMQIAYFHAAVKVVLQPVGDRMKVKAHEQILSKDASSSNIDQKISYAMNKKMKGLLPNQILLARLLVHNAHSLASLITFTGKLHGLPEIPTRYEILWLAYRAYRTVLGYQGGRYPGVIRGLKWLENCVFKSIENKKFVILQKVVNLCIKSGMFVNKDK